MKKEIIKKITICLIVSLLLVNTMPLTTFAQRQATSSAMMQEATPSAVLDLLPSLTPTPQKVQDPIDGAVSGLKEKGEIFPEVAKESISAPSAGVKLRSIIRRLAKTHFKATEDISVVIENIDSEQVVTAEVTDQDGNIIDVTVKEYPQAERRVLRIRAKNGLKPGKYHLKVENETGEKMEQDFLWGVLAVNTNKSVYAPGETARIALAVLDEEGMMVCDAQVKLKVKNEKLKIDDDLSTENGKIRVNPECMVHGYTTKPDYETEYTVGDEGTYGIEVTATTENGTYTITDAFNVKKDIRFDVDRNIATRLYPPATYPATITITAQEDFKGVVTEIVPEDFVVSQASGSAKPFDEVTVVAAQDASDDTLGLSNVELGLPYEEFAPLSLGFSKDLRDPKLKRLYAKFNLSGHDGVDFEMPIGTPVLSTDDGEVVLAEKDSDYGTTIVIEHSWGKSYYGHLSRMLVKVGDRVEKGEEIAKSGNTGLSIGPHLHLGIKPENADLNNGYFGKINPLPFLGIEEEKDIEDSVQVLSWNVDVKKGETVTLGYSFKSPNVSPQFYTLGPLKMFNQENMLVFEDSRMWQLAIDAQVTLATDVDTTADTHNGPNRLVMVNDLVGYAFYVATTDCKYVKTMDGGVTWESPVSIDTQTDCIKVAVWYDRWTPGDTGNTIHVITTDTGADDLWYNTLDTLTDTVGTPVAISGSGGVAKTNSFSATTNRPAISKATDGDLFAGIHDGSGTDDQSYILRCASTCGTASNWSDTSATMVVQNDAEIYLSPLAGGDMMAVRFEDGLNDVEYMLYENDTPAWSNSWADISATSAVAGDNTIYEAIVDVTVDRANGDIYTCYIADNTTLGTDDDVRVDHYNGSWNARTDVVANSNDGTSSGLGVLNCQIAVDDNTNTVYVLYTARTTAGTATTANVYYRYSTDDGVTWSTRVGPLDSSSLDLLNPQMIKSDERIYATWIENNTNDSMAGETVVNILPNNNQILRHGKWFSTIGNRNPFTF